MQGESYQAKTVLEQYEARNKTFLVFPGIALRRLPNIDGR